MIISIEINQVALEDHTNPLIVGEAALITRERMSEIIGVALKPNMSYSYEPLRPLYHVIEDYDITTLNNPDEDIVMKAIEDNIDALVDEMEAVILHDKVKVDGVWVDSPETIEFNRKQLQMQKLSTITVESIRGNVFDGDEVARADMLSALNSISTIESILKKMDITQADNYKVVNNLLASFTFSDDNTIMTIMWKLANNEWVAVAPNELSEASALAIQRKAAILAEK